MRSHAFAGRRFAPLALAAGLLIATPAVAQDDASALDDAQRAAVEQVVRELLVTNPEIVVEALEAYQARQEEIARAQQSLQVQALSEQILHSSTSPVGGNPEGDVTLVEFFDYNCGYCKRALPAVEAVVAADAGLRVVYKEFPILGEGSMVAARAALASQWQDLYGPFHAALMGFDGRIDEPAVFRVAAEVGLDVDQLRADMDRAEVVGEIAANMELARQLQINGTPAFIVGSEVIPGAVPQAALEQAVSAARGG